MRPVEGAATLRLDRRPTSTATARSAVPAVVTKSSTRHRSPAVGEAKAPVGAWRGTRCRSRTRSAWPIGTVPPVDVQVAGARHRAPRDPDRRRPQERVAGQDVLDVHEQSPVLLLVLDAQLDQGGGRAVGTVAQESACGVDVVRYSRPRRSPDANQARSDRGYRSPRHVVELKRKPKSGGRAGTRKRRHQEKSRRTTRYGRCHWWTDVRHDCTVWSSARAARRVPRETAVPRTFGSIVVHVVRRSDIPLLRLAWRSTVASAYRRDQAELPELPLFMRSGAVGARAVLGRPTVPRR